MTNTSLRLARDMLILTESESRVYRKNLAKVRSFEQPSQGSVLI